jgi:hypothetical protein
MSEPGSSPGDPAPLTEEEEEFLEQCRLRQLARQQKLDADAAAEAAARALLDQTITLGESSSSNNSLFPSYPSTMALQGELFILKFEFIDESQALEFHEQALRYPHLKIHECMQKKSISLLDFKIMTDPNFTACEPREKREWQSRLNILQIAKLILQYFCPNGLGDNTLAESFGNVPFHYQISDHKYENATFMRYVELVDNYVAWGGVVRSNRTTTPPSLRVRTLTRHGTTP